MLLTPEKYIEIKKISKATYYNWRKEGKVNEINTGSDTFVYTNQDIKTFSEKEKNIFLQTRVECWKNQLREAHTLYKINNKSTAKTTEIIKNIEEDVDHFSKMLHINIKGYDKRSLQIKIKTGRIDRKNREEKSPFRNNVLRERPQAFDKAMELVSTYFQDALGSMSLAIDKAIDFAKNNEDYYEVAAVNIHTLKRHISRAAKQSG